MKPEILVLYPTPPRQMAMLESEYQLHRYDLSDDKPGLLADVGPRCTGIVTNGHVPLGSELVEKLPALRIVACGSVGYDTVDVPVLTGRGIRFTNTPDVLTDDVADTAIMLMLAVRRNLVVGDRHVRSGEWASNGAMPLTSRTAGSRVGIVGLGRIGQAIAVRCLALKQEIAYFGRNKKAGVDFRYFSDLTALATWSDVLIAVTPGGAETQGLVSAAVLHALGPNGTFVNVSRGTVVDEPAMIDALQSGRLGAAGLDVFLNEPDADPRFAALQNVVLYPHHASGTVETRDAMAQLVVDNLAAYYAGKPLLTPVN